MVTRAAASKSKKTIVSGGSLTAQKFEKLGLRTPEDFVLHLPLRYEDETRISSIADLRPNMNAQIEISVVRSDVMLKPRRQRHIEPALAHVLSQSASTNATRQTLANTG